MKKNKCNPGGKKAFVVLLCSLFPEDKNESANNWPCSDTILTSEIYVLKNILLRPFFHCPETGEADKETTKKRHQKWKKKGKEHGSHGVLCGEQGCGSVVGVLTKGLEGASTSSIAKLLLARRDLGGFAWDGKALLDFTAAKSSTDLKSYFYIVGE